MSRVTNTVSKFSRALGTGTSTINRPALESHGLTPAYAELLRSHRRNQWDNKHHPSSKPFATKKQVPEPTTNPIVLPAARPAASEERHTPVPILSRPKNMLSPQPPTERVERSEPPQVVYVSGDNPNNPPPSLENLHEIDADEAQIRA